MKAADIEVLHALYVENRQEFFTYNAPHHPLVRQTLEAERKNASPRIRQLIGDLLTKDYRAVLREVRGMDHNFEDYPGYDHRLPWRIPFRPSVPDQPHND